MILRGNAGQDIFFDDEDRQKFYSLLDDLIQRFGIRVHAFCLMSNHVHLAVQTAQWPLSKPMQSLAFRYTRYVNRRQQRVGHLFQGRYKALLVDSQSYLLELTRYIHLNPVRAGLVSDPAQYPHSAHLGYLGKARFSCLTADWVLSQFHERVGIARRRYEAFVMDGLGQGHLVAFHRGNEDARVLGADKFLEQVLGAAGETGRGRPPTLGAIVAYVCKSTGLFEEDLIKPGKGRKETRARALIAWIAKSCGSSTLVDIARRFGRDLSGISRAVSALERVAAGTTAESRQLQQYRKAISQA